MSIARIHPRTVRLLARAWAAAFGLALAVAVVLSADAARRAIAEQDALHDAATIADADAGDQFPGAALLYAAADVASAAPARGVTGTTALPALPIPIAAARPADVGVVAARPFSLGRASAVDRGRALDCLTTAVYYEAASESDAGQAAVAQVILNRVRHPAFPATVCGVVYQGSERTRCQFSFACDGAVIRLPGRAAWVRAERAARMALAGYVYAPVGLATHYHTYAVTPAWNRALVMTDAVGAHFFHRWKGFWGTAAAFGQRYAGGEPLPGAHLPAAVPAMVAAVPAPAPTPVRGVQPPIPTALPALSAAADALPDAAQVLDRWKDSGRPLR